MKFAKTGLVAFAFAALAVSVSPAQADDAPYTLEVSGKVAVGAESTVSIKIVPAAGYHFNKEFPTLVKEPDGAKIVSQSLDKSDARGVLTVKVNADKANPTLKLKSAVCKEGQCAPFSTTVTLKS